jgi:hypothetical protein
VRALLAGDPLRPADPGAADGDAQALTGPGRALDRGPDRILVGDVGCDEGGADLRGERLAPLRVQVGDHDLRACLRQHPRGRLAEARCPAGDKRPFALDPHGAGPYRVTVLQQPDDPPG